MSCSYHVYILECRDKSLYVGFTQDLEERLRLHQAGQAASYTSARLPIRLVYSEGHPTQSAAVTRERQLKRWSRQKKLCLIQGDLSALKALSRRRR
jgi:putative endonuclease